MLPAGFDEAVRTGTQPPLQLFVGGESLASTRVVLSAIILDLIRHLAGAPAPIAVEVTTIGVEEATPVLTRLVPMLVLFVVLVAGGFVPALSLVEEKEKRTLAALLVTPARMVDVLIGKGILGFLLAMATGTVTLILNGVLGAHPIALILVLALATLMAVEVGLLLGAWARDSTTLFAVWKSGGILLVAPIVSFLWPDFPRWIAQLFPTYYFLAPLYDITARDAGSPTCGRRWQ